VKARRDFAIVLKAWTNTRLNHQGRFHSYDGVEVLPKPLQQPHPPVWMAAGSDSALAWAASQGFSVMLSPHDGRQILAAKRTFYAAELAKAGHSDAGRDIPTARLIAIAPTREKAAQVARRGAEWLVQSYVGPQHNSVLHQKKDYEGMDPLDFYMKEVIVHGTSDDVVDQLHALRESAQLNYLLAAPLSRETFTLLTDHVVPRVVA
jgi:alkanesulfonate monooxygenase SsuD/methylene tetrahydromethanopterin reductase-like flavin-dependent oxidoreductase (luciferase family)